MELILIAVLTALAAGAIAGGLGIYLNNALASKTRKASLEAAEQQIKRAQSP